MTKHPWLDLLGRNTEDSTLRDALAKAGVKKIPKIKRDETDVRIELGKSLMLIISSGEIFSDFVDDGGDGVNVLTGVFFRPDPKTPLPNDIQVSDTQKKLRARFGEPIEGDRYRADAWLIDGRTLWVDYDKSFEKVVSVGIMIPEPELDDDDDDDDE